MEKVNRRTLLASLGVLGGVAVVAKRGSNAAEDSAADKPEWKYSKLAPNAVRDRAYLMHADGGCMYAVVGSVLGELADRHGEPFCSFPIEMMRYGAGGVGDFGSLCGVANGANALGGLFHSEKAKAAREEIAAEFCGWFESTPLPSHEPSDPVLDCEIPKSVADSVLCHVSVARWCKESGCEAFSKEKKERCRRLAADGAKKIVEILNRKVDGVSVELPAVAPAVASCIECHGKNDMANAVGGMNCASCHQFDEEHP